MRNPLFVYSCSINRAITQKKNIKNTLKNYFKKLGFVQTCNKILLMLSRLICDKITAQHSLFLHNAIKVTTMFGESSFFFYFFVLCFDINDK